jgi:class I fructose-bisphosphate aldolase
VIFSGGPARDTETLLTEIRAIRDGGGFGSILGRNAFQRPRAEALAMLQQIVRIYKGEES